MPVPSFLASFADKAQSAINASPLAAHLPSARPTSPDAATQPSANEAAAQGPKSHTLGAIQNQLRAFSQQYTSATPVQRIITTEKGIAIDFDSVSRDAKSQSKELYTWGQNEPEDLKDVTDRLAYLNFVQGSLVSSLALKLDAARAPLKALRDAETSITPRRNIRAGLHTQLARIEHDQQRGMEKKIAELKDQIAKAELDDRDQENEIELLKRKAIRESEQLKWEAFREYGEKLVLLSQAAAPIIGALPTLPPSQSRPYTGAQATGAARASLQRALDNYKTGHINLPPQLTGADLHRSDTRSFGESHASELSSINSDVTSLSGVTHPGVPVTPPTDYKPPSQPPTPFKPDSRISEKQPEHAPLNPATLNHSPVTIPSAPSASGIPPATSPTPLASTSLGQPAVIPTVAETGVPVAATVEGPGPASGSLHDIKAASPNAGPQSGGQPGSESNVPVYGQQQAQPSVSADEEKKRLQAAYSQVPTSEQQPQVAVNTPTPQHESAEEEKKRLEREERERILQAGTSNDQHTKKGDNEDLPPTYQDL